MEVKRHSPAVLVCMLVALLSACSTAFNPLPSAPDVRITESPRTALAAGIVPAAGISVTDTVSGASVSIPAGALLTLDASSSDNIAAVVPSSIIVTLRPISNFLANQNGDFLTEDGLNLDNLTKVGALAVTPVIGRSDTDITITIPVSSTATGELTVWRFIPDDNANGDGVLSALPAVGRWGIVLDSVFAAGGNVVVDNTDFGQYIVTTAAPDTGGGGNELPTVTLEGEFTGTGAPLTVDFTATASDPDGDVVRYEWDFDGDGTFPDADATTTPTTQHVYATDGSFLAAVRVVDDQGGVSTPATTSILVGDQPPAIGALTPLTAVVDVETTFTLVATDPDGDIGSANFAWDLDNDGTYELDRDNVNTLITTFDAAVPTTIGAQVTDEDGLDAELDFTIAVTDTGASEPVTLTATPSPATLGESTPATVNFTTVLDPPTTTFSRVVYDFGDGTTPVTETDTPLEISHDYTTAGTFNALVTVTPTTGTPPVDGTPITDTVAVVVNPFSGGGGGDPTATLTATPASGDLNASDELEITFTTVIDPATTPIGEVAYRFEDTGNFEVEDTTPLTATHTYTAVGVYEATVRITPVSGTPFTATATVTVNGNAPPVASFLSGADGGNPLLYSFNASGSTDDGSIVDYDWDFGDGSANGFGVAPTHTYAAPGTYIVVLTVTDNGTPPRSDTATATITITP